ncbi:hypothetical protein, partial [Escherichia coli]|uniref:hypothetical protein n=1 Tax=Escherichia coli TaxID=562 RepID=UPI00390C674D
QGPDRTLDYLFHSPSLTRLDARVRRSDTLQISNHLPLAARFLLPQRPGARRAGQAARRAACFAPIHNNKKPARPHT